jgi:hypothetical protein
MQSIPGVEIYFGIPKAPAGRHVYQEYYGDARLGNNRKLNLLTFFEGKDDAATIIANDLEGLQSTRFLGNIMIDFYVEGILLL